MGDSAFHTAIFLAKTIEKDSKTYVEMAMLIHAYPFVCKLLVKVRLGYAKLD